jgi:3-hydroxyacyl-CoA dehydrogenase
MTRSPDDGGRVALFGAGTIGGGWAATYLARRHPVVVVDPAPAAQERLTSFLTTVWPSVRRAIADAPDDVPLELVAFAEIGDGALGDVRLVHESAPEDVALKREVYAALESEVPAETLVLSSSGGLAPSVLQAEMAHPERFAVAHPLSPVYALPLVEVIGGEATSAVTVERTVAHLRALGKRPVVLRREVPGYLTNRLTFALLREAVHCLAEGVVDAQGVEDAVVYGITPRYLVGGPITSLALAGGPGGMAAAMRSFAPAVQAWWDDLGSPRLTDEVAALLVTAADEVLAGRSIADVLADRDRAVVETVPRLHDDLQDDQTAAPVAATHERGETASTREGQDKQ